jgi:hypothetical protein
MTEEGKKGTSLKEHSYGAAFRRICYLPGRKKADIGGNDFLLSNA